MKHHFLFNSAQVQAILNALNHYSTAVMQQALAADARGLEGAAMSYRTQSEILDNIIDKINANFES